MLSEGCRKCLDDVGRGAGSAGMMSEGRPLRWAFNAPFKIVYHTEMAQKRPEKKIGGEEFTKNITIKRNRYVLVHVLRCFITMVTFLQI